MSAVGKGGARRHWLSTMMRNRILEARAISPQPAERRRSMRLAWFAVGLAALSCATLDRVKSGNVTAADVTTAAKVVKSVGSLTEELRPEQEYYVGRSVATNILAKIDYKYVDKDAIAKGDTVGMTRYVNEIGGLLAAAAMSTQRDGDRPAPLAGFHFVVIQSDTVSAYSAPGGYVFVSVGAVKLAKSEDELACVLAHEVAHVVRGHALGNIQKSRFADVGADVLQAAGREALTPAQVAQLNTLLEGLIKDTMDALFVKGYSRDTEFEADRLGVQIAAAAGYDPSAMSRFLANLAKVQDTGTGGFNATHPAVPDRLTSLGDELKKHPAVTIPKARTQRFVSALEKMH